MRDGAKEALVYDASLYKHSWSDDTDKRAYFPVTLSAAGNSPRDTLSSPPPHAAHLQVIKPTLYLSIRPSLLSSFLPSVRSSLVLSLFSAIAQGSGCVCGLLSSAG